MLKRLSTEQTISMIAMSMAMMLMITGHAALHGQPFGIDMNFNPAKRYVSDYAGHAPEGLWIKSSIFCFSICIIFFCRSQIERGSHFLAFLRRIYWILLAIAMVAGLSLVVAFDVVPEKPSTLLEKILYSLGQIKKSAHEGEPEHSFGFGLFCYASFAMVSTDVLTKLIKGKYDSLATSLVTLILMGITFWWLSNSPLFVGVPQRVLIALIAFHISRFFLSNLFINSRHWLTI